MFDQKGAFTNRASMWVESEVVLAQGLPLEGLGVEVAEVGLRDGLEQVALGGTAEPCLVRGIRARFEECLNGDRAESLGAGWPRVGSREVERSSRGGRARRG